MPAPCAGPLPGTSFGAIVTRHAEECGVAITRERFDMAMERLTGADWQQFEQLASSFLASDFPALRTMAAPSGDGGRDSELFTDDGEPTIAVQYSVASDWSAKITGTFKRLEETFPHVSTLVYLTNQKIGAKADDLRKGLRLSGKVLDIRDRAWFLDRSNIDRNREEAAESLARKFVDPLLPSGLINKTMVIGLDTEGAKTALLFLEMQVQDTDRSLGLTKASYDTLTLAALRDTNTANRLKKSDIYLRVQSFLPSHPQVQIRMKVDASLRRLEQKSIRHRKDQDEYHLHEAEIVRVKDSVARIDLLRRDFEADLLQVLAVTQGVRLTDERAFVDAARRVLETYFLRKGEDFAQATIMSEPHEVDSTTMKDVVLQVVQNKIGATGRPPVEILLSVINTLVTTPSEAASAYLRLLLESYTLFAFLAATPDVQKATRSMFGSGEIWLDTSVVLPVLAETALPEHNRPFTEMFKQAHNAGLRLHVTSGVLEEIERHINRSKSYVSLESWVGSVPFLFSVFAMSGGTKSAFSSWTEKFVGTQDPIQDLADYLSKSHRISLESASTHDHVSETLAQAVRGAWQDVHTERRRSDDQQLLRLAAHDAEMYLHVLSSRLHQHGRAPLGYTDWWLTLDSKARTIMDRVDRELRPKVNIGPVLSIDYLIRYLAFGPSRNKVDVTGSSLARVYADILVEPIPSELMSLVTELRTKHADLPENVVQRRIRDTLNRERSRLGLIDAGGPIGPADLLDAVY